MGGTGSLCLSTSGSAGQSISQLPEGNIDGPRLAQHALVLGPGDVVDPDSPTLSGVARPPEEPSQRSLKPEHSMLGSQSPVHQGAGVL